MIMDIHTHTVQKITIRFNVSNSIECHPMVRVCILWNSVSVCVSLWNGVNFIQSVNIHYSFIVLKMNFIWMHGNKKKRKLKFLHHGVLIAELWSVICFYFSSFLFFFGCNCYTNRVLFRLRIANETWIIDSVFWLNFHYILLWNNVKYFRGPKFMRHQMIFLM